MGEAKPLVLTIEWVALSDERLKDENYMGWMGGWVHGEQWDAYIADFADEARPYLEALKANIVERGLQYTGQQHCEHEDGTPLFNDGKYISLSWRAWGDLMAAVWNTAENTNKYTYMSFYM
mgnify:CR=1 FL=1